MRSCVFHVVGLGLGD